MTLIFPNFNPCEWIASYLVRNNPRYSHSKSNFDLPKDVVLPTSSSKEHQFSRPETILYRSTIEQLVEEVLRES
jgi:hypothetical protein